MSFQRKFITNWSRRPISTVVLILLNAMQRPNFPLMPQTMVFEPTTHWKALHLDDLFGSKAGGCKPSAENIKKESRFESSEVWDCQFKLGQATAYEAMDRCIELADRYGIGQVSVDQLFIIYGAEAM